MIGRRLMAFLLAAFAVLLPPGAGAHQIKIGDLVIFHPSAPATDAADGVVFMTIENHGATPDRLLGAETDAAARVELHRHETVNGAVKMVPVEAVELLPGQTVKLTSKNTHLMLVGLKRHLVEYDSFPMILLFEKAGRIPVDIEVDEAGATEPAHQ